MYLAEESEIMNICILTKSTLAHQMGGMEVHSQALGELAVNRGHSVTVITTRHPEGLEYEEKNGIFFYYLSKTRIARYSKSWWKESRKKILQLHETNKFDVIWAESFSGYYYTWKTKSVINVPIISIIQGGGIIDHIKSEWGSLSSWKEFFNFVVKYLPESIFLYLPLFWKTLKYSDAIVAVSKETAEVIQREFNVERQKVYIVHNSVDTNMFKPDENRRKVIRERYAIKNGTKIILMAGVVHKQKGMHLGIEAFAQIKKRFTDVKMLIVGSGPQLESLKKLAKDLDIAEDIYFCGLIPNKETPYYYNTSDLYLNPTLRVEGLAIATVEAMACGLPAVISRIGGTDSTIEDGKSGFFVEPENVESLVEKSNEILNNPELAKEMGEKAREKAVREFSQEKMIEAVSYTHLTLPTN